MRLIKSFLRSLFFFLLIFAASRSVSYADGGFPTRPGRLLISPSVSYYFANSQWDSTGHKARFPKNGHFNSVGVTLYAEYGISRRWAAIASLPFVINTYNDDSLKTTTAGLADLETGLRYYITNINFIYYFSIQGTAITPLYTNRNLGYGEEGAELKLAFSGTGHLFGKTSYFNASDGVRRYFGKDGPTQNRYSGTYGISLDKLYKNQVSLTVSGINSFSDNKAFSPILNTNKNYSFLELSASYGHAFNSQMSLFGSVGRFLTGRNTAVGTSASLAFIYRLDYR